MEDRFFDSTGGGDSVLFIHLFWFFGHPEVYILILPGFGLIRNVIIFYCEKPRLFGKVPILYAIWSIGIMGFLVWAHHMFTTGLDIDTRFYYTSATMVIAVPTGIKVYRWLALIWGSRMPAHVSFRWAIGFLGMFTFGGITGITLSNAALDLNLHDTYFVVGHFHYVLSIGAVFSVFAGLTHYMKLFIGYEVHGRWSKSHFNLLFIGANITFFPHHLLGISAMPRRVPDYLERFSGLIYVRSHGSSVIFFSVEVFLFFLSECLITGRRWRGC